MVTRRPATDAASCNAVRTTRIDDALLDEVAIFAGLGVVAEGIVAFVKDLTGHHGTVLTSILGDLPGRRLQRAPYDVDADPLIVILRLEAIECL